MGTATTSAVMYGGTFANTGVDPAVGRVTWVHKDGRWTDHRPAHVPMAEAALVYDPDLGTVLLLGASTQVWSWDGTDWAERSTPSAPPGRLGAAAVYDPFGHVVLLFGGHVEGDAARRTLALGRASVDARLDARLSPMLRLPCSLSTDVARTGLPYCDGQES